MVIGISAGGNGSRVATLSSDNSFLSSFSIAVLYLAKHVIEKV
jgi:hypothetical protein